MSRLIVGIDFGTSTTVVRACIEGDDNVYSVKHKESSVIPTLMFDTEDGKRLYGKEAEDYHVNGYKGTLISNFKMGLASADAARKEKAKNYIKDYLHFIHDLFAEQKHQFPAYQDMKVRVSYPAKWTNDMAEFMISAVKEAGFGSQVDGMTEPEAASCYSLKKRMCELMGRDIVHVGRKANVMMLDMGAGTSDISIFQVSVGRQGDIFLDNVLSYPSVSEPNSCGGREIDRILSAYICKRLDIPEKLFSPSSAKQWKESIVSRSLADNVPVTNAPSNVSTVMSMLGKDDKLNGFVFSRSLFEAETTTHWENLYRIVCDAFKQYRKAPNTPDIGPEDIDLVLLTGGHSQWYCVEELLMGRGVNGYIGTDYRDHNGQAHKALDFRKIKQDKGRFIREALPHETVAAGLCLKDATVKIEALATNNVWGQLLVNDVKGEIFPIMKVGEKLPVMKTVSPSVPITLRLNNECFDVFFKLYYGETLETAVDEHARIVFDGRMFLIDLLGSLLLIGWMSNDYKVEVETTITLEENGTIDFKGVAKLYDMDSKGKLKKSLEFSKGDNKSASIY